MTRDDIIRMAREAAQGSHRMELALCFGLQGIEELERFSALVAAAEREACAKVCNSMVDLRGANDDHKYMADKCAAAIRARIQQTGVPS